MTNYRGTSSFDGGDIGTFQPILFDDDRFGYQAVDNNGSLLGILWPDGRYDDPYRYGNITWKLCEETAGHRQILNLASWEPYPIEFQPII